MALKVFDLQCEHGHVFEGWFHSDQSYEQQLANGELSCPVCASQQVKKQLSAPRLNVSHLKDEPARPVAASARAAEGQQPVAAPSEQELARLQAEILQHLRSAVRGADDVGEQFAEEARRIHYGEARERSIRGVASPDELNELHDEGIEVMPIPHYLDEEQLH